MNGETGEPFIDANMKGLKLTGYISNRGQQNVPSYFIKNLQYNAGIGADLRRFRIFHIHKQQKQYDPNKSYIRKWLSAEKI
ncbi:FAD-binding domain-containing protein [Massilibacterium senegalense]|uniref:FAD-binding domain-containing protein n=1 Tax=Massilibacterium senegalense TaxID=1632858 RepID=UPI0007856BD9|nr:FAD-binding domain-containing protein [Massilibacterium senegalense]